MYKYDLKSFFENTILQNDEWISNGHFVFKKSLLTKAQKRLLEAYPQDQSKVKDILLPVLNDTSDYFQRQEKHFEFAPEVIVQNKNGDCNIFYNNKLEIAFNGEYYNFFISKKCKIYRGNGPYNPAPIFRGFEFMGVLLPIRIDKKALDYAIDYNKYITQIKQEQEAKEKLKKLNKKCLYINNNKAIVRNKPLKNIHSNLYTDAEPDKYGYVDVYIDLGIVFMRICENIKEADIIEDEKYYLGRYENITLDKYKEMIDKALNNAGWINTVEVKLMELAGEPKEYINKLIQHRKNMKKLRERERIEREKQRQLEEGRFVIEKNKIAYDNITQAEEGIMNGKIIDNIDITFYKSKYESTTTSLILYLMKKYNIKVPIKTQGWINRALASIKPDDGSYTYQYYTSSSDSTVFYKYLNELVDKIKEEYKKIA